MKKLFIFLFLLYGCQKNNYFKQYENTKIEVLISGEIISPGKYELEVGNTLSDLIKKAGGFTENADKDSYDLSRQIRNYEEIEILNRDNNKININTATQKQLENLEGVGKTLAQRVIEYRNNNGQFENIDDLKKVKGFSEKKYQKIYSNIKVR